MLCPLDWGLGHAARCVPLARQLQAQNNRLIIACNNWQRSFFEQELNGVEYATLFGYNVKYAEKVSVGLKLLAQFPRLSFIVTKEHLWLKRFLQDNNVDVVISDNRFGLYNKKTENVFITHQLFVPAPFLKPVVNKLNFSFIKKYNACWIPDLADEEVSLSGALSHGKGVPGHAKYMGPLSRFTKQSITDKKYDVLILLSGVEPQRTLLEKKLTEIFSDTGLRVALVRGTAKKTTTLFAANFEVFDIAGTKTLETLFASSKKIICRSGYSTLMDLHALDLNALLIPTPGQTEQEYLAAYWHKKWGYATLAQKELSREVVLQLLRLKDPALQKQSV